MSNIKQVDFSTTLKDKYLDYAISVIVGRALPDVRDGMKWCHRRIIYSMDELKLYPDTGYRKAARVVGDVLGKYHPHGDSSVYDAMVRMAQDFNLRYPLIDGHGNWGSQDGDSAAAYRYTEARMRKISLEMLRDIHKNTVDFIPNFDGEEREPSVLPSRFPNLLVNGSEGIAVGITTSIPPHNLNEVIDTIIYKIDNPNCEIKDLVKILKAPDFPTKATIINPQDMVDLYTNGTGKIIMRAKYHIEIEGKQTSIIITEIPYQVIKSNLLESLFTLTNDTTKTVVKDGKKEEVVVKAKINGVDEIIDESDREGMRINIKLKKNINPEKILPLLFKHSKLQDNYNAHFTVVYGSNEYNNQLLEHVPLDKILQYYINHQKDVLTRRTNFDLDKAQKRLHILLGLKKAITQIDKTIELIKTSSNTSEAREKLINYLIIDEKQANAILELRLQRLTGLEIETLENEYNQIIKTVEYLNSILNNENELLNVLKTELFEIKDKYGDERRTKLIYDDKIKEVSVDELIEDNTVTICISKDGYIKKNLRYSENQKLKDGDEILQLYQTTNKTDLLLFTNKAKLYIRKTYDIQECEPSRLGEYIPNLLEGLDQDEKVIYTTTTKDWSENLVCVFENGFISKMNLQKTKPQQNRKVAIEKIFNTESNLVSISVIKEDTNILLISQSGHGLVISTDQVNSVTSKNGKGVVGIKLDAENMEDDKVIGVVTQVSEDSSFNLQTEKGKELYILLSDVSPSNDNKNMFNYLTGNRGRIGNFIYNTRQRNDKIISMVLNK